MATLKSKRPLWLSFILFLCLIYFSGVVSLFIARAVVPRWPPLLALINTFAPFLFAPLLFIIPLVLLARLRIGVMGVFVTTGLFVLKYGSQFLTQPAQVSSSTNDTLAVMTFNLGPGQARPEQILTAIEDEEADIVTVQELTPATVKMLREDLTQRYPYSILNLGSSTTGLMSRYPIINSDWFRPAGQGRSVLHATLDAKGTPIHILAVHPVPPALSWCKNYPVPTGLDDEEQEQEAKDILRRVTFLEGPVLIMGDFNMSDQSPVYDMVSTALKDSYREVGWGFGFTFPNNLKLHSVPVPGPFLRIDYVFHSGQLNAQLAQVSCKGGSDHCYLVVKLTKNGGS